MWRVFFLILIEFLPVLIPILLFIFVVIHASKTAHLIDDEENDDDDDDDIIYLLDLE